MRVIAIVEGGGQPSLYVVPKPEPAAGEVLVRVDASSINGVDLYTAGRAAQGDQFPVVLGKDFAGVVEAVGDGTTRFAVGDRVFGWLGKPGNDGALAEYVTVPETVGIAHAQEGLDTATAGAIGLAGTAALAAVEAASLQAGQTVLVSGATGGVGSIALQIAAALGAEVIATAQSDDERDFVRSLGATFTVDYSGDLSDSVRYERPNGVDAVIHLAGDGNTLAQLLKPGGRLASTLGFSSEKLNRQDITVTAANARPDPALLQRLGAEAAAGRIKVPIQKTYRLDEVPKAIADFAAGTIGKLSVAIHHG
jgi:NADPH:quinone reductase-like Zn-dependent oxidoreductase